MPKGRSSLYFAKAGRLLAEAELYGQTWVEENRGISRRQLTNYRKDLQTSPELYKAYEQKLRALDCEWADELGETLVEVLRWARTSIQPGNLPPSAENIRAVNETMNMLIQSAFVIGAQQEKKVRVDIPEMWDDRISADENQSEGQEQDEPEDSHTEDSREAMYIKSVSTHYEAPSS